MSEATRAELPAITILLSTFNGGKFLREQLDSFVRQSYQNWTLFWRDDGSSDDTRAIMRDFTAEIGANRCVQSPEFRPASWRDTEFFCGCWRKPAAPRRSRSLTRTTCGCRRN